MPWFTLILSIISTIGVSFALLFASFYIGHPYLGAFVFLYLLLFGTESIYLPICYDIIKCVNAIMEYISYKFGSQSNYRKAPPFIDVTIRG